MPQPFDIDLRSLHDLFCPDTEHPKHVFLRQKQRRIDAWIFWHPNIFSILSLKNRFWELFWINWDSLMNLMLLKLFDKIETVSYQDLRWQCAHQPRNLLLQDFQVEHLSPLILWKIPWKILMTRQLNVSFLVCPGNPCYLNHWIFVSRIRLAWH